MKQCPACKREMREQLLFCPFDGQTLITVEQEDKFIGLVLDDKYRIDEKVGEGGMGKVYRATHVLMDHTVAVKILHPHLSSDLVAVERFRREARAAASIKHPNAVAVTDFGVNKENGLSYLVMEFLEGTELRDEIKVKHRLDFEESFIITQQICSALQAAHAKGIIHRDLKPDNIWLLKSDDDFPRVKVLDFGIAKLMAGNVGNLTQQGMIVGTPYYMSPEQCVGDELDARSDIYSLGIIAYELLTGQVPFRARTPMGVALKHANEAPRPPHELRTDLPFPIEAVILRALRKHREDRQGSAMELASEFEAALYQAGVELKLLTSKTPSGSPTLNTYHGSAYGSETALPALDRSTPPDRITTHADRSTPTDRSYPPVDQATPSDRSYPPRESTPVSTQSLGTPQPHPAVQAGVPELFQRWTPARFSIRTRLMELPIGGKIILAAVAAVLVLAVVVALVLLTTGKREETGTQAGGVINAGPNTPGTKTPAKIPPPPAGMVLVPGGKFIRGNAKGDEFETLGQEEAVNPFYLDQFEVTNKQYYDFVKAKNYFRWPEEWPSSWKLGIFAPGESDKPVTNVTWNDALEFAKSNNKRLPTEIEWEYAARGTNGWLYPWGNEFNANFANVNNERSGPARVTAFPRDKSSFEVFGMAGNVSEWTDSDYPGGKRTVRGGSYLNPSIIKKTPAEYARLTRRFSLRPDVAQANVGFRCARDAAK